MGGKVERFKESYFNQAYLGKMAETSVWDNKLIERNMEKASKRQKMKYGNDGLKIHNGAIKYKSYIQGKRGIIIGSEDPWRAYAAENFEVFDADLDDTRPAKPADHFPANDAVGAPDLSLMAKARAGFHGPYGTGINQLVKALNPKI